MGVTSQHPSYVSWVTSGCQQRLAGFLHNFRSHNAQASPPPLLPPARAVTNRLYVITVRYDRFYNFSTLPIDFLVEVINIKTKSDILMGDMLELIRH